MMNANEAEAEAIACAGGCGFFGIRNNDNLCSFCFKQSLLKRLSFLSLEPETQQSHVCHVTAEEPVKIKPRCEMCRKKVGMLGFNCRCGHLFCGTHRYPEEHSCPVDYKQSGRLELARQLPLVRADKLQRF